MTVHSEHWIAARVPAAAAEHVAQAVRVWAGKDADRARLRGVPLGPAADPVLPADADRWLRP